MTKCYGHEECEYNGQPECHLPDGMKCPHGVKADKPTNADLIRAMSDTGLAKLFYSVYKRSCIDFVNQSGINAEIKFEFQSTLSLRRATANTTKLALSFLSKVPI